MTFKSKLSLVMLTVVLGALSASFAWACTVQSTIDPLPETSGPVGSEFVVTGQATTGGHAEIRWNGLNGPVVGSTDTATDSDFAMRVTIPEAPAGVHYLVLVDEHNKVGPAAFEVTGPRSEAAALWTPVPADPSATEQSAASRSAVPLMAGMTLLAMGLMMLAAFWVIVVRDRSRARTRLSSNDRP